MSKLNYFEFIQKYGNGGFPVDNESAHTLGFAHGDSLVVLQKRALLSMLYRMRTYMKDTVDELGFTTEEQELLDSIEDFCKKEDRFIARGPDLPEESIFVDTRKRKQK